jgi:transcription antitermination factor NusG
MPLFPGYIFCRFRPENRTTIQRAAGVAGIVGFGGVDCPVAEPEMDTVLTLLRSGTEVYRTPFLHIGTKVRVRLGPLAGIVGVLQQIKNDYRLVISVEFLQRAVAVEVDVALVEPLPICPRPTPGHARLFPFRAMG